MLGGGCTTHRIDGPISSTPHADAAPVSPFILTPRLRRRIRFTLRHSRERRRHASGMIGAAALESRGDLPLASGRSH